MLRISQFAPAVTATCREALLARCAQASSLCSSRQLSGGAAPPLDEEPAATRPDLSPLLHRGSARRRLIDEALRVDHAGETAAVRIYEGQAAVLGHTAEGPTLASMATHERAHLSRFQQMLPVYRSRPSALLPVWSSAAYALGACSALLGREAAYAVTEAVEDVITAHYNDQLRDLAEQGLVDEKELRTVFRTFRDEEQEHLEEAVRRDAHQAPGYQVLSTVVKAGCKAAIWVAKKV